MTGDRVLYIGVDDREATRCLRALRRAGFATTRVRREAQAVIACRTGAIPVVVFDLREVKNPRLVLERLDNCGAVVLVIAPPQFGRVALRQVAWDYLDCRDSSYVRDLVPKVVRAGAFARMRRECLRSQSGLPKSLAGTPPPQSLADAVVAAIAQEIKTPLLTLCGYSQLLAEPGAFDQDVGAVATRLGAAATDIIAVVDQLVEVLRAQSEREIRARMATDFNRLVAAAVQRADRAARRQRRRIEFAAATLLPTVVLDQMQVARLLDGLLALALAGVPAGGVVQVATGVQRRRIVLRLQSRHALSGDGLGRLGEWGSRASAVTTALARVIVGAHGGDLTVQGSPGAALGVTMRLPISERRWAVGQ